MTVTTILSKIIYTGTGSVSVFAYPFRIFVDTDLVVKEVLKTDGTETTLVLTTDYTVSGAGDATGGNVTLVAGNLASTKKLVIERSLPQTQAFDLVENDNAPSLSYENSYDRAVMLIQELQTTLDSAIKLPVSVSGVSAFLPEPEADKVLAWNSDADALENQTLTQTDTGGIADGAVTTPKLASSAVTAAKLATDAVETAKIKNLAVTTAKIALLAVDTAQLAAEAVTTAKLALLAVDTAQLAADAVTGAKIEDDAVDSEHIAAGAIDDEHLSTEVKERTVKAWVNFNGAAAIQDSFNVSGIVDEAAGDYTISWDTDFASINYAVSGMAKRTSGSGNSQAILVIARATALVVGAARINVQSESHAPTDPDIAMVMAIGDQ